MNPTSPPTTENIRQRVFDAFVAGLRTIRTANNYETEAGANVFPWKPDALATTQLPGIVVRDTGMNPMDTSNGVCVPYKMRIEVALVPVSGGESTTQARKMWADLMTFVQFNRRLSVGGDRLTVTTEYVDDEMRVDQKSQFFAGIFVRLDVVLKLKGFDAYAPQP